MKKRTILLLCVLAITLPGAFLLRMGGPSAVPDRSPLQSSNPAKPWPAAAQNPALPPVQKSLPAQGNALTNLALIAQVAVLASKAPKYHRITDKELAAAIERFGDEPDFYLATFRYRADAKILWKCLEQHPDCVAARYLLLGHLAYSRKANSEEYARELAKLKATPGYEAYGRQIEWLAASRAKDTEALVRLSRQPMPGDLKSLMPDYKHHAMTMLTEVCGLDTAAAYKQARGGLCASGFRNMGETLAKQSDALITQNRSDEARYLLASAVSMVASMPRETLAELGGWSQMEYDLLSHIPSGQEAEAMFKPSLTEYRQMLERELQQAKAWNERLDQAAKDGDGAFIASFAWRSAEVGELEAARELLK